MWEQLAGFCSPPANAWRALSVQGWPRGERSILWLPKPQQMTTFRSVISLSSTAGQAIHFSTIKGQRSLCRAAVPLRCSEEAEDRQGTRSGRAAALSPGPAAGSSARAEQARAALTSRRVWGPHERVVLACYETALSLPGGSRLWARVLHL